MTSQYTQVNFYIPNTCEKEWGRNVEDCNEFAVSSSPLSPTYSLDSVCILTPSPRRSPQIEVVTLYSDNDARSDSECSFKPEDALDEALNRAQTQLPTRVLEVDINYKSDSSASVGTIPYTPSSPTSGHLSDGDADGSPLQSSCDNSDICGPDDGNLDFDALPSGSDYDSPYSPSDSPCHQFPQDQGFPSPPPKKIAKLTEPLHSLLEKDSCAESPLQSSDMNYRWNWPSFLSSTTLQTFQNISNVTDSSYHRNSSSSTVATQTLTSTSLSNSDILNAASANVIGSNTKSTSPVLRRLSAVPHLRPSSVDLTSRPQNLTPSHNVNSSKLSEPTKVLDDFNSIPKNHQMTCKSKQQANSSQPGDFAINEYSSWQQKQYVHFPKHSGLLPQSSPLSEGLPVHPTPPPELLAQPSPPILHLPPQPWYSSLLSCSQAPVTFCQLPDPHQANGEQHQQLHYEVNLNWPIQYHPYAYQHLDWNVAPSSTQGWYTMQQEIHPMQ